MDPLRLADAEDGDDVRVVQPRGGLRLAMEAGHALGVEERRRGQDLERDATAERFLLGLVDDAHPAASDLADDPVVGEPLGNRAVRQGGGAEERTGDIRRARLEILDDHQRGEEGADLLGERGIPGGIFLDGRPFPALAALEELLREIAERVRVE